MKTKQEKTNEKITKTNKVWSEITEGKTIFLKVKRNVSSVRKVGNQIDMITEKCKVLKKTYRTLLVQRENKTPETFLKADLLTGRIKI